MARNIWDVSDILLRQRAGDIYGGMFANLGQQVGAGIQQYGQNKQMAALGVADFESAAKADPEILQSLQREDVSKEVKSAFNKLKSGGVGVKDASVLSTYAKNFVTQKAQAIQQQADAMKLAEMQRLQQERVRMGELFGAMSQMEAQAVPQFYGTPAGAQTSTILDRPGMREQTARALASPTMQAARDLYQVMPSAVTPEALAQFAGEQMRSARQKPQGMIVDANYLETRRKAGFDVDAEPIGKDASGNMQYRVTKESPFAPSAPTVIKTGDSALDRAVYENLLKQRDAAVIAQNSLPSFSEAKRIIDEGKAITGSMADARLAVAKFAKLFGVDDASISNTEVLRSQIAVPVFNVVRSLGSGTAISDKDRDFAEKVVGGQIALDDKAILRLINIGERAARYQVDTYKKNLDRTYKPQEEEYSRARASLELGEPMNIIKVDY